MGTAACFLIVLPIASRLRCNPSCDYAASPPLQGGGLDFVTDMPPL